MAVTMSNNGAQAVEAFGELLKEMLTKAKSNQQPDTTELPLKKSDIADVIERIESIFPTASTLELKKRNQYAIIETAVRNTFNKLLATTSIESSEFAELWILLDIISTLSDDEQCEPALLFWLVEELLDSQTVAGCRRVFDYLESRRERITAKHFSAKNLVILRSCNELLRRLSRAEDTAFCGRVFIFLFQSFPLGDKSSVNLRGEFHTENVTTFDTIEPEQDTMDMDSSTRPATPKDTFNGTVSNSKPSEEANTSSKGVTFSKGETPISANELYPIFWSMQQYFSQPKKLFDPAHFATFKSDLEATMRMFRSVQTESLAISTKPIDLAKRGTKRKRSSGSEDLANSFNPKYLTSRDLFELEISDLLFRRNILVQVLIVIDFLLSLSTVAKERLASTVLPDNPNKSVMYADQTLNDDDAKWAADTKKTIAEYIKGGPEGAFFLRMVETVLSRDKNWARWKIENCPSIARAAVTPEDFLEAKSTAKKGTTNKRLRPNPLGSLDLKFLAEGDSLTGLERLKDPIRYQLPSIKSFQSKIQLDDMDISMGRDAEAKSTATEAKASKSWRALRIAGGSRLAAFDKIESHEKIDEIFQDQVKTEEQLAATDENGEELRTPTDRRPIVISGPSGVGKGTLITMLLEKHGKVIGKKASHTTRPPREGEIHGTHYFFVNKETYDVMRDGDEFLEYNNFNGNDYGTSRKVVEGILAQGKVPIMEMDMHGIPQLKENNYAARYIFLAPPDTIELENRLKKRGMDTDEKIQQRLEIAKKELEQAQVPGFHDVTFVNDNLEATYEKLESYIFGCAEREDVTNGEGEVKKLPVDELESEKPKATSDDVVAAASTEPDTTPMQLDDEVKIPVSQEAAA